jgi:thioredoxin
MKSILFLTLTGILLVTSCSNSQNFKSVNAKEFGKNITSLNNEIILDVRTPEEFNSGHINEAKNIDWNGNAFETDVATLDKTRPVMVYCMSGGRSKKASNKLHELGFKNIIELDRGYLSWQKETASDAPWLGMTKQEFDTLLASNEVVVVDFYAKWCGPCKKMAPYLEKMMKEYEGKNVTIKKIDADQNKSLFNSLNYQGLPVVLVYKNGKQTFFKNEFVSEEELRKQL